MILPRRTYDERINAKRNELAPYDRMGITSRYTDRKAMGLRKELQSLKVRRNKYYGNE